MMQTIKVKALTNFISDQQFEKLCADNPETKFETNERGELIVMSPTGSESGKRNGDLFGQIWYWNRQIKAKHERVYKLWSELPDTHPIG